MRAGRAAGKAASRQGPIPCRLRRLLSGHFRSGFRTAFVKSSGMHFNALGAYGYGARHIWQPAVSSRPVFVHTAAPEEGASAPAGGDPEAYSHQRMISVASHAMRQFEDLEHSLQPVE